MLGRNSYNCGRPFKKNKGIIDIKVTCTGTSWREEGSVVRGGRTRASETLVKLCLLSLLVDPQVFILLRLHLYVYSPCTPLNVG